MRKTLDSSVGFKWLVPEIHSDKALRIRSDFMAGLVELIAPDIYPVEIAHAITRAERQLRLTPSEGAAAMADSMTIRPDLVPYMPLLPRAYEISSATRQGVYDCLYVALAEREGCDLVTADDRLIHNLQSRFPFIKSLASMP